MFSKTLHILLAFNMLISSMGVTAYEHICQKNGTSLAFFIKSRSCCTQKKQKCCSSKKAITCETKEVVAKGDFIKKKPCCEDKSHYKKLNTLASDIAKVVFSNAQPIFSESYHGLNLCLNDIIIGNEKTLRFYLYKPPPLHVDDLRVLYQSFLC